MRILGILFNLNEVLKILKCIEGRQIHMSQEIDDFKAVVFGFLENIAADIQRLLDRNPGISDEDKASLEAIAQRASEIANIVPEP